MKVMRCDNCRKTTPYDKFWYRTAWVRPHGRSRDIGYDVVACSDSCLREIEKIKDVELNGVESTERKPKLDIRELLPGFKAVKKEGEKLPDLPLLTNKGE